MHQKKFLVAKKQQYCKKHTNKVGVTLFLVILCQHASLSIAFMGKI
tara:strand:- start:733 stop:870 length:138 start_codon:yes stop_codon:yes gene_type:complete